jgi:hypothetical protein
MKTSVPLLAGLLLVGVAGAKAQTVVQTVNFDETTNYPGVSGSFEHVGSSFFTGVFDPFDGSLGTLESFVIEWTLINTATGNLGVSGGSVSMSVSGSLLLDGIFYRGGVVNADGTGGPPNAGISLSASIAETDTFLVSGAGVDYGFGLLSVVTGADSFTLAFNAPVNFSVSGSATFDASTLGDVTLTYSYTPVPEPSSSAALLGAFAVGLAVWRRRR